MKPPYGGGDMFGPPVPHCLDQEYSGGGEGQGYKHQPEELGGPGLGVVQVGEPVDAGGGEEFVQLPP